LGDGSGFYQDCPWCDEIKAPRMPASTQIFFLVGTSFSVPVLERLAHSQ
jgi:hypothetical protein